MTALLAVLLLGSDPPAGALEAQFETAVRPVFVEHCQKCHGATKQNGGLRLDRREGLTRGGDSGPTVVAGKPDESLLVKAIRRHPDVSAMPPTGPLPPPAVKAIEEWVRGGAVWPDVKSKGPALGDVAAVKAAAAKHWAFQAVRDAKAPAVKRGEWSATSIDRFLLAKLEAAGLEPAPDAGRATLLRRVTFDLVGLPPKPEDVDAFISDPDPTPLALAKVVDRLLASPHYGERWGRHWLDVARYADTKGYVFQEERRYPFSYTYRDWVVRALNEDLPYDEFVRDQIAADKYPGTDNRRLAAMGFLTVGRRFLQDVNEITDDRIDVVTRGLQGLTVSCARCHDHKYDPVSMADYYGLYGVFASSEEPKELPVLADASGAAQRRDYQKKKQEHAAALEKFLDEQHKAVEKRLLADADKLFALKLAERGKNDPKAIADAARQMGLSPGAARKWNERWNQAMAARPRDTAFVAWRLVVAVSEWGISDKAKVGAPQAVAKGDRMARAGSTGGGGKTAPAVYAALVRQAAKSARAAEAFPALFGAQGVFRVPRAEVRDFFDRKQREQVKGLEREIETLDATHPGAEARAMVMVDRARPVQPHIFLRGNAGRQGPAVARACPVVLTGGVRKPFKDGSGRKELAETIANRNNPLTARVFVNRVWQWRFGKGLAASPSDFGLRSDPPSHPELLDHLASRFMKDGWSLKRLHRWMLESHAYQISSMGTAALAAADPDNRLLGRFPRLRLEWEPLRDAALAAAGRLDESVGGRPTALFANPTPRRRTLYGFVDRQNLDGPFRTFDFATPDATSPQRFVTIVPQQGLFFLNSPFLIEDAERFAERTELVAERDPRRRVERMYRLAFARAPESVEVEVALKYLTSQPDWAANPKTAWTRFAQALLMANEFAFVD